MHKQQRGSNSLYVRSNDNNLKHSIRPYTESFKDIIICKHTRATDDICPELICKHHDSTETSVLESVLSFRAQFPSQTTLPEPLLVRDSRRFSLYPIRYPEAFATYEAARRGNWESGEADLAIDLQQITNVLTKHESDALFMTFGFFQPTDGIVIENHAVNFMDKICVPEIRYYYAYQCSIEAVHSVVYGQIIDQLVKDVHERFRLLNSIENIPAVKAKTDWALKWMTHGTFAESIFAFSIVEGLFFSSSFCIIFWFKSRGLLPGISFYNELINRDECQHTEYPPKIIWPHVINKIGHPQMIAMMREAVNIEHLYCKALLPYDMKGMNSVLMCEYVEFVADYIFRLYDVPDVYNTPCPFPWMTLMGFGDTKTSIFEKQVADYTRPDHSVTPSDIKNFTVGGRNF